MREFKKGDKVRIIKSFFQHSVGDVVTLDKKGVERPDFWKDCNGYYLGDESYFKLAEEPKQEWIDDIPPVGCECEGNWMGNFGRVRVNAIGEESVLCTFLGTGEEFAYGKSSDNFRPLQTKDTEREEGINELANTILNNWNDLSLDCPILENDLAAHLHDAGYHNGPKVKELSDEEIEEEFTKRPPDVFEEWIEGANWARDYMLGKAST